jgi:5-methylcytosine-specific restriction endonuclease McrA
MAKRDQRRRRKDRGREFIDQYKKHQCCVDCGTKENLTFHHVKKKAAKIASMPGKHQSIRAIMKELRKCITLCEDCHKKVHNEPVKKRNRALTEKMLQNVKKHLR